MTDPTWEAFQPKTPYGSVPVLEVDGKFYATSGPLARYVAEQHGLAGSNALENLELASINDVMDDLFQKAVQFVYAKDETRKAQFKKDSLMSSTSQNILGYSTS